VNKNEKIAVINNMKHINKILIFIVNGLLIVIGVILMRDYAKSKNQYNTDSKIETDELAQSVSDAQAALAADRENKLRGLADAPKDQKTTNVTTQTTATTTTPIPSSSSSSSSSNSSSNPSSSTKTKTS
jgi:hypothetical protein